MPPRFFTRQELLAAGVPANQLRPGGTFQRVLHNLYVREDRTDFYTLVDAALHLAPADAVVSHHTAAMLWGGIVPSSSTIHLTVGPATLLRMTGVTAHRVKDRTHVMLNRRRVTAPTRTFVDLAVNLELVDLVIFGDTLVHKNQVTVEQLRAAAAVATGRGARRARMAAELVRAGSESVRETRTRLLIVLAGLPEPVRQVRIRDETGAIRTRPDLAYPEWKIAIYYDGDTHFDSTQQRQKDNVQREWLIRNGWQCVTIYARDLFNDPTGVLARIEAAVRANGGSARVKSIAWQRHFLVMK